MRIKHHFMPTVLQIEPMPQTSATAAIAPQACSSHPSDVDQDTCCEKPCLIGSIGEFAMVTCPGCRQRHHLVHYQNRHGTSSTPSEVPCTTCERLRCSEAHMKHLPCRAVSTEGQCRKPPVTDKGSVRPLRSALRASVPASEGQPVGRTAEPQDTPTAKRKKKKTRDIP